MTGSVSGRAWVFGDDIDTDLLAPGLYMKGGLETLAAHCLEAVRPDFAGQVATGDVVVAGRNFGIGSSREQAAQALKHLGCGAVLARSFGGIFYRNALNCGLYCLTLPGDATIFDGDRVTVDPVSGTIRDDTSARTWTTDPLPDHLVAMVEAGGLVPHLKRKLAVKAESASE